MKIGLLAYHSACNFGATLQLLSTYMYLINHQHQPIIINWVPDDLDRLYFSTTPSSQYNFQKHLRQSLWQETRHCRTSEDVSEVISQEGIEAVIIGSDAVAQHHPWLESIVFPCKTIVGFRKYTSDMVFPNPFWANWLTMLKRPIPIAFMSVSNQDSAFKLIPRKVRSRMGEQIRHFAYVSVRDDWTRQMFLHLTKGQYNPAITPDPVFAFNQNAAKLLPSKESLLNRFHLPEKYLLMSFLPSAFQSQTAVSSLQEWLNRFISIAESKGLACVSLPFSQCAGIGTSSHTIQHPLNPIDWYALIKHSCGYVGNNMHPIIVSLHNSVPFFSFDNYGTSHLNGLYVDESTSKIKHILDTANMADYRISCTSRHFKAPTPEKVHQLLDGFNKEKCSEFANMQLNKYNLMMDSIMQRFNQ